MALNTWQYTLVFILQALAIAHAVYFLAPDHTGLGGKRGGGWNHRTMLLSLGAATNLMMVVLLLAIPKRNVFFSCLLCSTVTVLVSSDTIWKCTFLLVGFKLSAFMEVVVGLAAARKISARLATGGASGASLLTQAQKACLCGIILNTVGLLAAPDSSIPAVIEIVLWTGALAESWVHFVAFEHTVNDTFGQVVAFRVQSAPPAAPLQPASGHSVGLTDAIHHAKSTKRKISRNVRVTFLYCHLVAVSMFLASPLLSASAPSSGKQCQVCLI
jgi:hypothetical protein